MNGIVVTALKRPYTFVVLSILIVVFGVRGLLRTPTDVFPSINIPVVAICWTYTGLMPEDMSGRVVYYYERALTATVNNIEHIESQSYYGRGIVNIYFQPGTDIGKAAAAGHRHLADGDQAAARKHDHRRMVHEPMMPPPCRCLPLQVTSDKHDAIADLCQVLAT
ncbi:efflux RND transporter permease subunit [Komagataeibacter rhaeticus]